MAAAPGFGEAAAGLRSFGEVDINLCDFVHAALYSKLMILHGCRPEEGKHKSKAAKTRSCRSGAEAGGTAGCFRAAFPSRSDRQTVPERGQEGWVPGGERHFLARLLCHCEGKGRLRTKHGPPRKRMEIEFQFLCAWLIKMLTITPPTTMLTHSLGATQYSKCSHFATTPGGRCSTSSSQQHR